ncbi:MAG: tetratricopeptide repeat protein, partial [Planctomycetota bacterium]
PDTGGRPAEVLSGKDMSVSSGRSYEISVWVKLESATAARAGVRWLVAGQRTAMFDSLTDWARGGTWKEIKTVARPPRDATGCRIVLMVAGKGSARFDDVVLRQVSAAPRERASFESGGFSMTVTEDGALTVEKSGNFLLWDGGVLALVGEDTPVTHSLSFRAERLARSESEVQVSGSLLLPDGQYLPASVSLTPAADRVTIGLALEGKPEGLAGAGLAFRVSPDYLSEFATMTREKGARVIHAETDEAGVEKVILGGPGNRLSLVSKVPSRLKVFSADGLRLAFLTPPGTEAAEYELVTDFSKEKTEARLLLSEAHQAASVGRLGEAIRLFERVVNEFPFDDRTRQEAEKKRLEILEAGRKRMEAQRAVFMSAKDFFDEGDLEKAREGAGKLAADYAGHELAKDAKALVEEVEGSLDLYRNARHEAQAQRLLKRALDFLTRKQLVLARACRDEIVRRYPGTEAAQVAKQKIQ